MIITSYLEETLSEIDDYGTYLKYWLCNSLSALTIGAAVSKTRPDGVLTLVSCRWFTGLLHVLRQVMSLARLR